MNSSVVTMQSKQFQIVIYLTKIVKTNRSSGGKKNLSLQLPDGMAIKVDQLVRTNRLGLFDRKQEDFLIQAHVGKCEIKNLVKLY